MRVTVLKACAVLAGVASGACVVGVVLAASEGQAWLAAGNALLVVLNFWSAWDSINQISNHSSASGK